MMSRPLEAVQATSGATRGLCETSRSTRSELAKKGMEGMASSSKRKTTRAKLNRENAVRERRLRKQAKKEARKQAAARPPSETIDTRAGDDG